MIVGGAAGGVNNMDQTKTRVEAQPEVATFKNVDELLHAVMEKENIKVNTQALRALNGSGRIKVEAGPDAAKATWSVNVPKAAGAGGGNVPGGGNGPAIGPAGGAAAGGGAAVQIAAVPWMMPLSLTRYDWDQKGDGQFWSVQLSGQNDALVQIVAMGNGIRLVYNQTPQGSVFLWVNSTAGGQFRQIFHGRAASLLALKQAHPDEVRQYLQPLLRRLTGKDLLRPGPVEVYSVFTDVPADAKAAQAVKDLLPQLEADSVDKREAASADLLKLGRAGVLAVLRLDWASLSQEQKARCQAFVKSFRQGDAEVAVEALRQDPEFLLEAMQDDDLAVRTAAKSQFEKLLGHAVNYDVSATPEARSTAMDTMRKDLEKEIAAKSPPKPAEPDNAVGPNNVRAPLLQGAGPNNVTIHN
jgi:hypothetical protein